MLNEARTPLISMEDVALKVAAQLEALARAALPATRFVTTEEALNAPAQNPVKRGMARKLWLQAHLPRMVPGARISLPHANPNLAKMGAKVPHVLVDIVAPKAGREAMLANWKLMLIAPGQERPVPHSLNSLMSGIDMVVFTDPYRPGVLERDVVNPVAVGSDILLPGRGPSQARTIVDAFRNAPSGVRTRTASVLAGNMYLASEFASEAKVGQSVLYTDDRGMRQRAILLGNQFEAAKLRHMPVRVWVRRAMEEFLLSLSGLSADRVQIDEQGREHPGLPPCRSNFPGAADGSGQFMLHMSFSRAWAYGAQGGSSLAKDDLLVLPGQGVALVVGKEQHRRVMASLRASQERIRQEEAKQRRAQQGSAETAAAGPARVRAAEDPAHVVISGSDRRARRMPGQTRGGGQGELIVLRADTSARMRRAIRMLVEGAGLQIYVQRHHEVGDLGRQIVRADLIRRLRSEIGEQPEKLARLEEQLDRMDTEAAATRRGFLDLARHASPDAEAEAIVERNGEVVAERSLFDEMNQGHDGGPGQGAAADRPGDGEDADEEADEEADDADVASRQSERPGHMVA